MTGLARLIASGFGAGLAPRAPGTAGSLVALVLGWGLLHGPIWALPAAIVLAIAGGVWAIAAAGAGDDPGWVVIDEFAGQWTALLGLGLTPPALPWLLAAFVLFRLLDIAKPGPIGWADRQHGALGVMADDVIAGAIAALVLWAAGAVIL